MTAITSALDREWKHLTRSPKARRELIRWSNTYDVFAGVHDFDEILTARRDPVAGDEILRKLAELAPSSDLAARTLLQAVLPGVVCLTATVGHYEPELLDDLVSLAWERIRTYPTRRPGSVAANIVLDVRKRYLRQRRRAETVPLDAICDVPDDRRPAEEGVLARMLVTSIGDAHRRGYIKTALLEPVIRTRMGGECLADVAAEHGVDTEVMGQRRWRGERILRTLPLAG